MSSKLDDLRFQSRLVTSSFFIPRQFQKNPEVEKDTHKFKNIWIFCSFRFENKSKPIEYFLWSMLGGFSSSSLQKDTLYMFFRFGKLHLFLPTMSGSWSVGVKRWLNPFSTMYIHQEFQVPKLEVLNLIRLFWGWVFPYISLTYSLYR